MGKTGESRCSRGSEPEGEIPRLRSGLKDRGETGFPQFLNNPEKFRKAVKA